MTYLVTYGGNNTQGFEFESNNGDALQHLINEFRAAGNDCVTVYPADEYSEWDGNPNTSPAVDMARYSPEGGGSFYRCDL